MNTQNSDLTNEKIDDMTLELAKQVLLESREPQLDEDGYDINDPYAQQAKLIDQQRKK